jgi:lysyl-tRNA synthetase class 2
MIAAHPEPYPYKFHVNLQLTEFIEKYTSLKDGESLKDVPIRVAGRIHSVRAAGKKLKFYDMHGEGTKVQIHANAQ